MAEQYSVPGESSRDLKEYLVTPDVETKTTNRRWSIFLIIFLVILAVSTSITTLALAITLGVRSTQLRNAQASGNTPANTSDDNVCLTPGCIELATQITASLNQSVDPCQDFYQFSCGNWVQNNIIFDDSINPNKYGAFGEEIFRNTIGVRVRKILESGNDGGIEAVGKARRLYQSCVNNTLVDSLGNAPLLDLLRTQLGGWPLIGIPEEGPWSINSSYFHYEITHGTGSSPLFSYDVGFDDKFRMNFTRYYVQINQPNTYLFVPGRQPDINTVKASLLGTLLLLNPNVNQSVYEEAIDNVLDLEAQLQRAVVIPPTTGNPTNFYYTVDRLQALLPEFDWRAFLTYLYNIGGMTVPSDLNVILSAPAYFPRLSAALQNISDTSVLRDYSKMLFVRAVAPYLGGQFAAFRKPTDTIPGNRGSCIRLVEDILPIALARPYVEQYVPEGTRENISMLADFLVKGFRQRVVEMNWLSKLSKQSTLEKVDVITSMVAYPANILDNDYVNGLYQPYTANTNDYFGNQLRGMDVKLRIRLKWTINFDKTQWASIDQGGAPTTINAFFNPRLNQFYVMAADLVNPIFKADWPDYFNFGALGSIVGHEITHGFDSDGQKRDKNGVLRMSWSNESQAEFVRRTQCFVDQYNQYNYLGVQVNGARSLPENIADNGGLQTSYQAYRMRAETSGKQQKLPNLPYTPNQLFFIAYSQVWCEVAIPQWYQHLANNDPHAPGIARVNAVINMEGFAEAFRCPLGTPMNPSNNRCIIW